MKLCAICLRQAVNFRHTRRSTPIRILYIGLMISMIVLTTFYCASYFTILNLKHYDNPIDTIEDLIKVLRDNTFIGQTLKLSSLIDLAMNARHGPYYWLGINMRRSVLNKNQVDIFNHYDGIQFVQNDDRNIFVAEEYILSYFRILYAQKPLLIGSEYLSMDAVAMIKWFHKMGLFQAWIDKIYMNTKLANPDAYEQSMRYRNPSDEIEWSQLELINFTTIFSIWLSDKITNSCEIQMDNSMDRIHFHMDCPNRVKRLYSIPIMENQDHLRCPIPISRKMSKPTLQCDANTMIELFKPFPLSTDEIIVWIFRDHLSFKTYFETDYDGPITEFCVSLASFRSNDFAYNYTNDMTIAFDLKELRGFLDFAIHRNRIILAYLQPDGKPIEFMFENSNDCSSSLIMSTINLENSSQPLIPPTFQTILRIVDDSSSGSVRPDSLDTTRSSTQEMPMNPSMEQQSNVHVLDSTIGNITNSSPAKASMEQQSSHPVLTTTIDPVDQSITVDTKQSSILERKCEESGDHPLETNIDPNDDLDADDDNDMNIIEEIYRDLIIDSNTELTFSQLNFLRGDKDGDKYDEQLGGIVA
ncbi:cell cycle checkpoint control protein RAD9A-like protein, partial [Euroglyphus maynei]